ncbi:phospho-N-acetylmuramoyl-pentapeptide-transferase [Scatolibacter rhodanostii]|uniref:phospho-N-acetylmuramoyl-pentapeptide- transferase n=1 Tax=Scatolibacter rhodanostii TaxID=2014781 RepID=UPI000C06D36A|nr:phospho-N-acetylmuramoyl-pentapeptide-transferase [Scatolibacter rhodanostii]
MNNMIYLIAAVIAFAVTAILGKWMIPFLHKLKFGQTIREIGPKWHQKKQGTPTMGGIMFIIGIVAAVAVTFPALTAVGLEETPLLKTKTIAGLAMAAAFGLVGFLDDYISVVKKRNLGLTEKQKLVLQFAIAAAYLASVAMAGASTSTVIPFIGRIDLGVAYYILSALVIVGMVNAVNFTDGIDGLNSSVCFFAFLGLGVCASMISYQGISILAFASAAACVGFLIWNFHPAKVFMGDTGSLFLGGIMCALAFGIDMPILLLPVGIISIIEILSVVLQVSYFKATKGKRLFKMAPIHHHFEMKGWSEVKVCAVFSLITIVGAVLAVLSVSHGI